MAGATPQSPGSRPPKSPDPDKGRTPSDSDIGKADDETARHEEEPADDGTLDESVSPEYSETDLRRKTRG